MNLPFARTWWIEAAKIIGGCFPGTPESAESRRMREGLIAAGVRVFVNLQEPDERGRNGARFPSYESEVRAIAKQHAVEVEFHSFPIADNHAPTPETMRQILKVLRAAVAAQKLAYVHCWGGHGRTGTVAGCWMVEQGLSPQQAFERITEQRKHDPHLAKNEAPQVESQRSLVRSWKPSHTDAGKVADEKLNPPASTVADRHAGALIGHAAGDALGTTIEFKAPGSFAPMTDIVGGGPFGLKPGQWTDDTSMALCLAESLVERGCFDPVDQLTRYVKWWKHGHWSATGVCFDIGVQTRAALGEHQVAGKPFCGPTGSTNAGNGSLMRLAPVAMAYASSPMKAITYAGESSRTTHGTRECVDACRYFAGLLVGAMQGRTKNELLAPHFSPVPGLWEAEPLAPKVAAVAKGSFLTKQPPAIRGRGYVVDCLEAALWAFASTDSYEAAVLAAVNLGDDADTTGAVYGQIAGAFYGASAVPERWRNKLAMLPEIEKLAARLGKMAEG